ncbi:hypothetical protein P8C59_004094 [Phyllachora maydis]|uniref:Putative transcription factor kapC n=1 Tax=Phyllachora maydis TaxID=1825666 RepID=A0AAD9I2P0_9PEZI|nr:hypothetical protein P8C59_004094 [Phyllachora maydis]
MPTPSHSHLNTDSTSDSQSLLNFPYMPAHVPELSTLTNMYPSPEADEDARQQQSFPEQEEKAAPKRKRENRYKDAPPSVLVRRRAQNRASQRAYRERKDKRIKDLEQMLSEAKQRNDILSQAYTALHAEFIVQPKARAGHHDDRQQQQQQQQQQQATAGYPQPSPVVAFPHPHHAGLPLAAGTGAADLLDMDLFVYPDLSVPGLGYAYDLKAPFTTSLGIVIRALEMHISIQHVQRSANKTKCLAVLLFPRLLCQNGGGGGAFRCAPGIRMAWRSGKMPTTTRRCRENERSPIDIDAADGPMLCRSVLVTAKAAWTQPYHGPARARAAEAATAEGARIAGSSAAAEQAPGAGSMPWDAFRCVCARDWPRLPYQVLLDSRRLVDLMGVVANMVTGELEAAKQEERGVRGGRGVEVGVREAVEPNDDERHKYVAAARTAANPSKTPHTMQYRGV